MGHQDSCTLIGVGVTASVVVHDSVGYRNEKVGQCGFVGAAPMIVDYHK